MRSRQVGKRLVQIVRVRREQHPPPVEGQQIAGVGHVPVFLSQVGRHKGLHRYVGLDLYHRPVRLMGQQHAGDHLLPQPAGKLPYLRRVVPGIEQPPDRTPLQKPAHHLRREVVRVIVTEQQIVQLLKGRLPPEHGLPGNGIPHPAGAVVGKVAHRVQGLLAHRRWPAASPGWESAPWAYFSPPTVTSILSS